MDINTQIRAWKDPKFRATLNADSLQANPAGGRLIELNEAEIRAVWGADVIQTDAPDGVPGSEGFVCTVSGECNGGTSCWSV